MNTPASWPPFLYHLGASQVPGQTQESLGGHVVTWGSATSSAPRVPHIPVCSETPQTPAHHSWVRAASDQDVLRSGIDIPPVCGCASLSTEYWD